ncbi:MAG: 2,3-cyclic 3-phosphodiesterase, partial [Thermoleophilaceae bacterium]|nr:2,3-cyclic 3-phosphodiesterase [Thermoleophilaceae bacterium]
GLRSAGAGIAVEPGRRSLASAARESDAPRRLIFIAYALPPEAAGAIATWARGSLGDTSGLRHVAAANLHITLVFCGRLPSERVEEVVERTRAGIVVQRAPVYAPARVRVLARAAIALELDAAEPDRARRGWPFGALAPELASAGLRRQETREWLPHVTVARAGRGRRPAARVEPPDLSFAPAAIVVLESVSVPGGVRYDECARFPFQPG